MSELIVGVDFDNTLVSYDELIYEAALERCLIEPNIEKTKRSVRDCIRQQKDGRGEIEWQRLQALVYGPEMARARPVAGALECLAQLRSRNIPIFVVSHKTEFANYDETQTSLRGAALGWMTDHRFFEVDGLGLDPDRVFFADTREMKIQRIQKLGCTHFIDDLEEVFLEASFPPNVRRILFTQTEPNDPIADVVVLASWEAISDYLLGE